VQVSRLPERDLTVEEGIPVTTVERTLLDNAADLDPRQLERMLVAADRTGRLRWGELERIIGEGQGRAGIVRLRRLAEQVDPNAVDVRSGLEIDFLALCREHGLPRPHINVLVEDWLVDFFWPAERVIVEVDSYGFHSGRPEFERDHRATMALQRAGYAVHRITEEMLAADADPFLALVSDSLRS
jgi:hypothetical protein